MLMPLALQKSHSLYLKLSDVNLMRKRPAMQFDPIPLINTATLLIRSNFDGLIMVVLTEFYCTMYMYMEGQIFLR